MSYGKEIQIFAFFYLGKTEKNIFFIERISSKVSRYIKSEIHIFMMMMNNMNRVFLESEERDRKRERERAREK